jgi:predicted DNA-binding protein
MAGRRAQFVSTPELDVKIFALIKKLKKSESALVRKAVESYIATFENLKKLEK